MLMHRILRGQKPETEILANAIEIWFFLFFFVGQNHQKLKKLLKTVIKRRNIKIIPPRLMIEV